MHLLYQGCYEYIDIFRGIHTEISVVLRNVRLANSEGLLWGIKIFYLFIFMKTIYPTILFIQEKKMKNCNLHLNVIQIVNSDSFFSCRNGSGCYLRN